MIWLLLILILAMHGLNTKSYINILRNSSSLLFMRAVRKYVFVALLFPE